MTTEVARETNNLPGDAAYYVGYAPADVPQRQQILRVLANVPPFVDAMRKLSAGDVK